MHYNKMVLVALMLACSSVGAMAQSKTITGGPYFGCKDSKVDDKIGMMMAQGDKEGWTKLLVAAISIGQCKFWEKGEKVYLDEAGFARHCLRPAGEVECYWTPREAVQ